MSHAAAGEVLYNWRVFPLHLDEPPVAALQQRQAHWASLDAAELRQLMGGAQSGPGPAVGTSDEVQRAHMRTKGESLQRQMQAGAGPRKDACTAWPEDGGLHKGPAVYRYTACSCCLVVLLAACSCASRGSAAAALSSG